jgi:WD40 repeat protein
MNDHRTPVRLLKICVLSIVCGAGLCHVSAQEWTGQAYPPSTQCLPRTYDPKEANYESWIGDYRNGPLRGSLTDRHRIELTITVIDGDDLKPADNDRGLSCGMTTSFSVSSDGTVSTQRITPFAVQGAGPGQLAADDLKTSQPLIATLSAHPPDDYSHLPPLGRRVVLQVRTGTKILARVYDRADMPDSVLEILGLAGATHGPLTMNFTPSNVPTEAEFAEQEVPPDVIGIRRTNPRDPVTKALRADTVTLAVSPDRSLIVTRYLPFDGRIRVTDAKKSAAVYEETDGMLDRRWIYVSHASFTPDGRFLLLLSNLPALRIYDTQTWRQVDSLPGMPPGGVAYYPSSDWKYGVVVSRTGEVDLWDATAGRKLATLDLHGELQNVSFSPDNSLVAVTSVLQNKDQSSTFHLRVWETKTGQFMREMRSLYYFAHDGMGNPIWWANGKYLLAQTKEGRFGNYAVGIWNVESGKFRGGFSGCSDSIGDPFAVALVDQQLFDWCPDGKLLTWNAAAAIDKIDQFENSLKALPTGTDLARGNNQE